MDLLDGIAEVCRRQKVRAGTVALFGALDEVEIENLDAAGRALVPRRLASTLTVVHAAGLLAERDGKLQLELACALSRERDSGVELLGGRLRKARVQSIDFVIETFDDLLLRRSIDASGLPVLSEAIAIPASAGPLPASAGTASPRESEIAHAHHADFEARGSGHVVARGSDPAPQPAPSTPPAAPPGLSWAEVAQTSAEQPPVEEQLSPADQEPMRPGDVIVHPSFGPCEVERIEGDMDYAHVRLKNNRLVRLSLEVFQIRRDGFDERERRRFRAVVSRG